MCDLRAYGRSRAGALVPGRVAWGKTRFAVRGRPLGGARTPYERESEGEGIDRSLPDIQPNERGKQNAFF